MCPCARDQVCDLRAELSLNVESGVCECVSCVARVDYGVSHFSTRAVKTLTNHLLISVKHQKHLNPFY